VAAFETAVESGALILDTRVADVFEKGFIPGSLNIGLNGMFAVWVGTLIDIDRTLVLITDEGKESETVLRLARVGYEKVAGYLDGGIPSWTAAGNTLETVNSIDPDQIKQFMENDTYVVLDVRKPSEFESEHITGAINIQLSDIATRLHEIDPNKQYIVHCAAGYRSMMAASIMKSAGIDNFVNVHQGWSGIKKTDLPTESSIPALN
jgi:rhodanese-related sulfurtransferase